MPMDWAAAAFHFVLFFQFLHVRTKHFTGNIKIVLINYLTNYESKKLGVLTKK